MSTREKLIKARLGMPALAWGCRTSAWPFDSAQGTHCRRGAMSRSHFYKIKQAVQRYGAEGSAPGPRRWQSTESARPLGSSGCVDS